MHALQMVMLKNGLPENRPTDDRLAAATGVYFRRV